MSAGYYENEFVIRRPYNTFPALNVRLIGMTFLITFYRISLPKSNKTAD
jgi:hypothetical protein